MKKIIIAVAAVMFATASMGALISYDSFSDAVSTNGVPSTWASSNTPVNVNNHSSIKSGSLAYTGLKASEGNSWGLGEKTDDYYRPSTSATLAVGDTLYYSFLMRLNSPLNAFSSGAFRFSDDTDPFGSGIQVGWGTADPTYATMGFSLSSRNGNWTTAISSSHSNTPQTYASADTVYLVVASYTRGATATGGSVKLWINPDSSTFGTAAPATPTLTLASYASDANWNKLEFISNGSGAGVPSWQVDEFRVATDWASVVPAAIPEPATVGMLGLGALITLLVRRLKS